ncbi:MAG TPA: HD domain-containing protein [Thermodesulfobacteriota bacterium]|nr:HD domain-containing protein [Thermodesulfobacteriota bacterium]
MLITLALGLIASGLILFFVTRERKPVEPAEQEITLDELSVLWMHWNKEDKKANTVDSNPPQTKESTQAESVQKEKSPKGWQNDAIKEFWKVQVLPWRGILESQSALFPVMRVLGLLDKHGSCPSIVSAQDEQETKDLGDYWSTFAEVSLLDHTLRVTNNLLEIYKSHYKDQILRGAYILAGLSHDLGKIPALRKRKSYSLGDHPVISAGILTDIGKVIPYIEMVIQAVKSHHHPKPQDELAQHLQQADKKAREEELILLRKEGEKGEENEPGILLEDEVEPTEDKGMNLIAFSASARQTNNFTGSTKPTLSKAEPLTISSSKGLSTDKVPPDWLRTNIDNILKRVLPHINQVVGFNRYNARWKAFSMPNGICYIDPEFLLKKAREVMEEKKITDINFIDNSLREKAKILIADALRERGWLGEGVKEGYYGAYWNCYGAEGEMLRQEYRTPVFINAFGVLPNEIELRKTSILREIKSVELSTEARR